MAADTADEATARSPAREAIRDMRALRGGARPRSGTAPARAHVRVSSATWLHAREAWHASLAEVAACAAATAASKAAREDGAGSALERLTSRRKRRASSAMCVTPLAEDVARRFPHAAAVAALAAASRAVRAGSRGGPWPIGRSSARDRYEFPPKDTRLAALPADAGEGVRRVVAACAVRTRAAAAPWHAGHPIACPLRCRVCRTDSSSPQSASSVLPGSHQLIPRQ